MQEGSDQKEWVIESPASAPLRQVDPKEPTRSRMAIAILCFYLAIFGLLTFVLVGSIVINGWNTDELANVMAMLSPIHALVGAIVGFYFSDKVASR